MKPVIKLLCCCLLLSVVLAAQNNSISYRIILIGDAGELKENKNAVIDAVKKQFNLNDNKTAIIYLGDNVYPSGIPEEGSKNYEEAINILRYQSSVGMESNAEVYFVPGNHDWGRGKTDGWEKIKRQQQWIDSLNKSNIHFFPKDGCPGPEEISINDKITLVIMDSQWWLQQYGKPGIESDCDCKTKNEVTAKLEEIAYRNKNKLIIFATHHPFRSGGVHGGYFSLKQHVFPLTDLIKPLYLPLPFIGSAYPLARGVFGNIQDIPHPLYRDMIKKTENALSANENILYVSGHDHVLQLLKDNNKNYIVSGSGAKDSRVRKKSISSFASVQKGFTLLEMNEAGELTATFFSVDKQNSVKQLYTSSLLQLQRQAEHRPGVISKTFPDSLIMAAHKEYNNKTGLHHLFFGKNYRKEWAAAVTHKVFDIGKEKGGLKILQRGGGHQTMSLRLQDSTGKQWVLRSIQKNPVAAMPEALRETFAKEVVQDQTSAANPYAPLVVPVIAEAVNVPHANPVTVVVPDDERFGQYQKDAANNLFLFEEREPGTDKKTYSTLKTIETVISDNDNNINQQQVLRARLLDIFLGDWDRHEDQWRWADEQKGKGKTFYAIPRDRDQAFFVNNGIIPGLLKRPWILPFLQGLHKNIPDVKRLAFEERYFDRFFLNGLDAAKWKETVTNFVNALPDSVLVRAVQQFPAPIYKLSGNKIYETLKGRRGVMVAEAMKYYRFISREVDVIGSNKNEQFEITRLKDGKVQVIVYKINKDKEADKEIYNRIFNPSITKEIRLYGLNGKDKFILKGNEKSTIKIRMIGGKGKDEFSAEENATVQLSKNIVYDLLAEQNKVELEGKAKLKLSGNPAVNKYEYRSYKYNKFIPIISGGYNIDDGLLLGGTFTYIGHGFRKEPQKLIHKVSVLHALSTNAFQFKYEGRFTDVIGKTDLMLNADVKAPNNNINFFGYGSNTGYNQNGPKKNKSFYRTRYNLIDLQMMLQTKVSSSLSFAYGIGYRYFHIDKVENKGRFIYTYFSPTDSAHIVQPKSYGMADVMMTVDSRNNKTFPTRGLLWNTSFNYSKGLNSNSNNLAQLKTDFSILSNFTTASKFIIATRFGGGINFGDMEFFQAVTLGGNNYLRGYRHDRFSGTKMLYGGMEMRLKLFDFASYIFPGSVGLVAFDDVGTVWYKKESNSKWHNGIGGGIYFSPANLMLLTITAGHSNEGTYPYVSLGFRF